ncbi:MAG TPA: ABC transporter ATP-binding protein [Tissierellia bacterium]|nr:ABC transporter ATP-binding protein [Tissierellia bacterium]
MRRGFRQVRPGEKVEPLSVTNLKVALKRLIEYNRRYLPAIVTALIIAILAAAFRIAGPNQLKIMADEIALGLPGAGGIDFPSIRRVALILALLYGAGGVLSFLENFIMATVSARISQRMRSGVVDKLNKLPFKYFDQVSYGDVLSRMSNDVDAIGHSLNQNLDNLIVAATMFVGSLVMMFYNSWILALVAVVSSVLGIFIMTRIMGRSQKYFIAQQEGLGSINGHIEEIYSGHQVVKAYNAGREVKATFEGMNESLYESAWKSQFLSGMMMPLMHFVGNFGYVAVSVVGAVLVVRGVISFGVIVAFMMYVRQFTQPLSQVAQSMQPLQRAAAASGRVFEFFDEEELMDESHKYRSLGEVAGDVSFVNVRFGYDKAKPIIHDFSAEFKAGQKVAIVGPTGAGKTTLVNLLMRFYEIDGGEIKIDGIPISQVPREEVHDQFGMVLQDTWLFEGSVADNIRYSKTEVSDEQIIQAAKAVGLHHFIQTLPQGYDTILDESSSLSAGQKQLITIARAMIEDAPLLILDEATSSVDTRTEQIVQRAMDRLSEGRTSFVIAHRLSTIKNADIILVMKDGDIIEQGNHEQLLAQDGFYAELYNSQFEPVA